MAETDTDYPDSSNNFTHESKKIPGGVIARILLSLGASAVAELGSLYVTGRGIFGIVSELCLRDPACFEYLFQTANSIAPEVGLGTVVLYAFSTVVGLGYRLITGIKDDEADKYKYN